MMKIRKFKHKITGKIAEQRLVFGNIDSENYNVEKLNGYLPKEFIENSNDWQEIIEKDYEILSILGNGNIPIRNVDFINNNGWEVFLNNNLKTSKIHSIKRLSDGEIFTIGDEVKYKVFGKIVDKSLSTITSFNLVGNFIHIATTTSSNWYRLNDDVLKHKKPLFVTEDGVDVFEGDKPWTINTRDFKEPYRWGYNNEGFQKSSSPAEYIKLFSTKEKAQEYIDLHKPKYSLNDIQNMFQFDLLMNKELLTKRLKQLNK